MKQAILLTLGLAFALPIYAEDTPAAPAAPAPTTTEAPAKHAKEKPKHTPEEIFKKKDTNNDGFLSKEEFTKGSKDAAKAEAIFTKKDKNADGKLSCEEFASKGDKKGGKKRKDN